MKNFSFVAFLIISLFAGTSLTSCKQNLKANQFNIYVTKDNTGWHFVDLTYDTVHNGYHRIDVKFDKGQKFQTALIRSDLKYYRPTFLYKNGDTIKGGLWFLGEYNYDSLQKKFLSFYMPTEIQRKLIKDYTRDPSYDSFRHEMDIVVETYIKEQYSLK